MMAPLSSIDWRPALWLAAYCAPLLGLALLLGCIPRRRNDADGIRLGNPLLRGEHLAPPAEAQLASLAHLFRTQGDEELRPLITGLRHLPFRESVPLLRRQLKSSDPELQLYAQCVLQEGQSRLRDQFQLLARKIMTRESPAILASFLEVAHALLESPLTPASEQAAIMTSMHEAMSPMSPALDHPRALCAAAISFLHLHEPAVAQALLSRLPEGSSLHADLAPRIAHVASIQNPPPPLGAGYQMT